MLAAQPRKLQSGCKSIWPPMRLGFGSRWPSAGGSQGNKVIPGRLGKPCRVIADPGARGAMCAPRRWQTPARVRGGLKGGSFRSQTEFCAAIGMHATLESIVPLDIDTKWPIGYHGAIGAITPGYASPGFKIFYLIRSHGGLLSPQKPLPGRLREIGASLPTNISDWFKTKLRRIESSTRAVDENLFLQRRIQIVEFFRCILPIGGRLRASKERGSSDPLVNFFYYQSVATRFPLFFWRGVMSPVRFQKNRLARFQTQSSGIVHLISLWLRVSSPTHTLSVAVIETQGAIENKFLEAA